MSYYTGRTLWGSTVDDLMTKCLPSADIPFCWQNLNGFSTDHLSTPEPYSHEVGSYQTHCNAFIPPPIDQDNPILLPDETDLILPPSVFTKLADIPSDSSNFSIHMQLTDSYPQSHDTFLDPQTHILQRQEPSYQKFTPALLPNAGLSYQLNGTAHLNPLLRTEISGSILLDNFDPQGVVGAFVPNPQRETAQMNPVLATTETHNIDMSHEVI